MKLIREFVDFTELEVLKEDIESEDGIKEKVLRLRGPFLVAEARNKNNRIYPLDILQREVNRYNDERIKKNRAVGTCDHEDEPQISLDKVSHVIEKLEMRDNIGYGVARVLETMPKGKILKALVQEGIVLGMSTRGIGSLTEDGYVQEDFQLLSIDAILDPSGLNCYVEGVLENKEYIREGDQFVEVAVDKVKKEVEKEYSRNIHSPLTLKYLHNKFLKEIEKNIHKR